jgi:hypothetical protein
LLLETSVPFDVQKDSFPWLPKKKTKLGLGFDSNLYLHSCGGAHFLLSSPSLVDLTAGLLSWALACFFLVHFVLGIQLRFTFASGLKERKKERDKENASSKERRRTGSISPGGASCASPGTGA